MTNSLWWTALMLLLAAGCAHTPTQKIRVRSQPVGAEVEMVRLGQMRYSGSVHGMGSGEVNGEQFEDAPIVLGTTPLAYEFLLQEDVNSVSLAGAAGRVTKTTREVILRARLDRTHAERRVTCTGGTIDVDFVMVPDERPAQEPQSRR